MAYRAPVYAIEKRMVLDLLDVQSPIRAGYEPVIMQRRGARRERAGGKVSELGGIGAIAKVGSCSPANHVFGFATQVDIVRNCEVVLPVDDFLVCFVGCL